MTREDREKEAPTAIQPAQVEKADGGLGAEQGLSTPIFDDENRTAIIKDARMVLRAVRAGWDVPQTARKQLIERLSRIAEVADAQGFRYLVEAVLGMDNANIARAKLFLEALKTIEPSQGQSQAPPSVSVVFQSIQEAPATPLPLGVEVVDAEAVRVSSEALSGPESDERAEDAPQDGMDGVRRSEGDSRASNNST